MVERFLTDRLLAALRLLCAGRTPDEVAVALGVGASAVRGMRTEAMLRLGARALPEACAMLAGDRPPPAKRFGTPPPRPAPPPAPERPPPVPRVRRHPPNPATQPFADALRAARLARGLTMRELAERLNAATGGRADPGIVSSWETNSARPPGASRIAALAEILGADPVAWCALAGKAYPAAEAQPGAGSDPCPFACTSN